EASENLRPPIAVPSRVSRIHFDFGVPDMSPKTMLVVATLLVIAGPASAEEVDAVINDATRAFTKRADSPEKLKFGRITLDSQGKLVSMVIKEGKVTRQTKVAMGKFDERKKIWMPGEVIHEGIGADLFKDKGKILRVRLKVADDNATIMQILVTNTD